MKDGEKEIKMEKFSTMSGCCADGRSVITNRELSAGLVIVGGGIAGVSTALAAARHGADVILIQDRPVLGGNASSEIRMGITGAAGDNCKETGILEELQLNNYHFNPLLRYTLWDDVLLSAVLHEPKIRLLLNTSVQEVVMEDDTHIAAVRAWNCNEYCRYTVSGRIFADCSGDSILRLSGAEFRQGREAVSEYREKYAPEQADSLTMGNSLLFELRKCSEHRPFLPPEWAKVYTVACIPPNRNLLPEENNFWWMEYGGEKDTVADAGEIQLELKKIAYGVWAYLKNHPDGACRNYELDWIGSLPGKRESFRYVGDYTLTQNDILAKKEFPDAIGHGGWPLDDHDPRAIRAEIPSFILQTPSPYQIPYRILYSRNIENLMFAGRNISATHMAFSSTRVMGTCSVLGQAAGTAAAIALRHQTSPRGVGRDHLAELQDILLEDDQFIPGHFRTIPEATREAAADHEALRDGWDRKWSDGDHGVWLAPGESVEYRWNHPRKISGARIVFDTDLQFKGKRQHKHEGVTEYIKMPEMLVRSFRIEAQDAGGNWHAVFADPENYQRLRRVSFSPTEALKVRLTAESAYGPGKIHLFSFEVK